MRTTMLSVLCNLSFLSVFLFPHYAHSSAFKTEITETAISLKELELIEQDKNFGEIIAISSEVVALGEAIYTLVQRGRPVSQTKAAPISIIPRDSYTKAPVDVLDLEGERDPVKKKYVISRKNGYGHEVARIELLLHFNPERSYFGKGKYITNAIIIPLKANSIYGWDLDVTMDVTGVGIKGRRENPIATATLTLNYQVKSVLVAMNETIVIDIDGTGRVVVTE